MVDEREVKKKNSKFTAVCVGSLNMNGEYKYPAGIGLENTLAHTGGFFGAKDNIIRRINQKEKDKKREEIKRVKGTFFFILREG